MVMPDDARNTLAALAHDPCAWHCDACGCCDDDAAAVDIGDGTFCLSCAIDAARTLQKCRTNELTCDGRRVV